MQRRIDPEEIKTMTSDRRSEVLASAIIVFAERGLEAAQLSSIARDAGTSLAALHREFGGKDDLFRAAVRETARGQVLRACSEPPPGPAAEQLRNFCGRCWEVLRTPSYAALHRLWVTEVPRDPDLSRFYAEEVYGTVHGMLERIIERGIVAGQFRPVVPRAAA